MKLVNLYSLFWLLATPVTLSAPLPESHATAIRRKLNGCDRTLYLPSIGQQAPLSMRQKASLPSESLHPDQLPYNRDSDGDKDGDCSDDEDDIPSTSSVTTKTPPPTTILKDLHQNQNANPPSRLSDTPPSPSLPLEPATMGTPLSNLYPSSRYGTLFQSPDTKDKPTVSSTSRQPTFSSLFFAGDNDNRNISSKPREIHESNLDIFLDWISVHSYCLWALMPILMAFLFLVAVVLVEITTIVCSFFIPPNETPWSSDSEDEDWFRFCWRRIRLRGSEKRLAAVYQDETDIEVGCEKVS